MNLWLILVGHQIQQAAVAQRRLTLIPLLGRMP
jgi:hypothetical protein